MPATKSRNYALARHQHRATEIDGLADVAFSGEYADLLNAPPHYIVQTLDDVSYTDSQFMRGHNIIGVRYAGACDVRLPSDLSIEKVITVKDEAGAGPITISPY